MTASKPKLRFAVLATDTVLLRLRDRQLEVLLIPVVIPQFKGKIGLPGGLIDPKETAEQAAVRHLRDKAGVTNAYIEQLYTFSGVKRDPRGRVVSVAHLGLVAPDSEAGEGSVWYPVRSLPQLAYDHSEVLNVALERLRARVGYTTIIRHLLPRTFTLTDLQQAYEDILGRELDKRNFRKKILALDVLTETGRKRTQGASRPAELYHFSRKGVETIDIL